MLVTGVGATAAVVALYVASRTVDLWFLPPHGHGVEHLPVAGGVGNGIPVLPGDRIEPVGALDLACLGAELVVIAMLMSLLRPGSARGPGPCWPWAPWPVSSWSPSSDPPNGTHRAAH